MRIRGIEHLKKPWRKFRGRLMPGPVVLVYHRIARLQTDPYLLAVSPEHFEEQLAMLRRRFDVVSMPQLSDSLLARRKLGPVVALTFDDGYADNTETALPLLVKYEIPATFYLASGFVGTTREQLHDDLERLVLGSPYCPDQLKLTIRGKHFVWKPHLEGAGKTALGETPGWISTRGADPTPRHTAFYEIFNLLRMVHPSEREEALVHLRLQCGDPGPARPTHRAMTWDQARQLAACELASLGAHTVTHPVLSSLSLDEQCREIQESRLALERNLGRPVTSFCYPFGNHASYTPETIALVRQLGFANACANFRARIGQGTNLHEIPRFVVRDWNGDEFLRRLRRGRL